MKIVLIDGKNALYRHHYVCRYLTRNDGHPTGAIHGCLNSLCAMSSKLEHAAFVWVWDGEGETWRHRMMNDTQDIHFEPLDDDEEMDDDYISGMVSASVSFLGLQDMVAMQSKARKKKKKGYKANRVYGEQAPKRKDKYPTDERARALLQLPVLQLILTGLGLRQFQVRGLEGDDLVAMLASRLQELEPDVDVIVHSGDKDYYQLLPDVRIMTRLHEGKLQWVHPEDVLERFGVSTEDWVKYRALTGDSSDNIPHLWKVGPKTALKMLEAGIDASEPDYRKIDEDAFKKFARFFQPHGPAKLWGAVHGNYKLCKLVDDIESPLLSPDVRERLEVMFNKLDDIRRFRSRKSIKDRENYRKVGHLLSRYELNTALANLDILWNLP